MTELEDQGGVVNASEAGSGQEAAVQPKRRRSPLMWFLIALLIIAVIAILFFLLRGCTASPTPSASSTASSTASSGALTIENKIHTAIHPLTIGKGTQLDTTVYIIEASTNASGVVAVIRLNQTSDQLNRAFTAGTAMSIATACEDAVIAKVPEVHTITVVDMSGALIDSATRK